MKMNTIAVFVLVFAQLAWSCPASASQAVDYRLPPDITPSAQQVHLRLDPSLPRYSGSTTLRITLASAKDRIGIYQVGLELASIELKGDAGTRKLAASADEWDIHWLSDGEEIPAGDYELLITFSGGYATDSLGMHRVTYEGRDYIYTQMEDMYARRVFPLFDEPSFKIPWELTITAPQDLAVVANTPVERVEEEGEIQHVSFRETRPLPSYLLAFAVGPMDRVPLPGMSVPGYVYTPAGGTDKLGFVLRETHRIVAALEDYFGSSYPFEKLDFVAVPEFAFGAMENPGLITYRTDLLMVGDEVSGDSAVNILMVIAHEVAHIWYGDVVTMKWWDDLWLNEAFASWMAWSTIEKLYPELEVELNLPQTQAFGSDQKATARAIRRTVRNSKEVFEGVGLNYSKGHALLRMLEAYVGREAWQKGIREYIRRYAWKNAAADDLWAVIAEVSGLDVGRIANDYLNQPGVALVTVGAGGDVSQRRYVVPGEEVTPQTWRIPMNVKYKKDGDVRQTFYLFEGNAGTIDLPAAADWIFPDAGGNAYFRWATTVDQFYALMDDVELLTARERIALIDNVQALFGAELLSLSDYLYALEILLRDPHPLVFLPAVEQFKVIGDELIDDTTEALFSRLVDDALSERFAAVGVEGRRDDSESLRRMRPRLLRMLGEYGADPAARDAADELTQRFLATPDSVEVDLAKEALRVSALHDDGSLYDDYIRVYRQAGTADRKSTILQSIYFRNPEIVERHLDFLLTDAVSGRDALTSLSFSSSVLDDKAQVYAWLERNLGKLMVKVPFYAHNYLPQALGGGCDATSLARLERFFAERAEFANGLERARLTSKACIRRKQKHVADLKNYLAAQERNNGQ
jgi:alanyl aminopeptidase